MGQFFLCPQGFMVSTCWLALSFWSPVFPGEAPLTAMRIWAMSWPFGTDTLLMWCGFFYSPLCIDEAAKY